MARGLNKLTSLKVKSETRKGRYGDGGGLWLQVSETGTKSWLFRFTLNGKARQMGLGPVADVTLSDAREFAADCRKVLRDGKDPIEAREATRKAATLESAKAISFKECASSYIDAHKPGWRNSKHSSQWENTLKDYAYPHFGNMAVASVDTGLVMKAIEPIWAEKTETASRVRGRIEKILDWAATRGYRQGENPARWRGHLENLLPARSSVHTVKHFPALPFEEIGEFMKALRKQESTSARCLEFLILTALRPGTVRMATWNEVKLEKGVWEVPAEKMKKKRPHRVPLSDAAVAVLEGMAKVRISSYVFPGLKPEKPLSNNALDALLERMNYEHITSHGFRSTFKDWASERTAYPDQVSEMALAHIIKDKVEAAYRRGDLFEKRARLMKDWAEYCDKEPKEGEVISINDKRA